MKLIKKKLLKEIDISQFPKNLKVVLKMEKGMILTVNLPTELLLNWEMMIKLITKLMYV
jgi:hypothetical protein